MNRLFKSIVLCIAPIALVTTALLLKQHAGPYWLGSNADPEYAYILNSLNVTQHKLIAHIDHPGTTLQVFGAIVLYILHLFRPGQTLLYDVLSFPELYLHAINLTLVALIALSLYAIGRLTYTLTNNMAYALILQCAPFLSITLLNTLYRVSPEPMLILVLIWFSYLTLYSYYHKDTMNLKTIVLLSVTSGLAIVTKITAAPLILIPLSFLSIKNKLIYLGSTALGILFFTLPIYPRYGQFLDWTSRLIINTGQYGTGDPLIINVRSLIENFVEIFQSHLYLSGVIILLVFMLFRGSFFLGLLLFYSVQIVMVSKFYAPHYLVPSLSLMGVSTTLLLIKLPKLKLIAGVVIVMSILGNLNTVIQSTRGASPDEVRAYDLERFIKNKYHGYTRITYYHSSSPEYALWFGGNFASNFYSDELTKIYSRQYFYDLWSDRFYNWSPEHIPMPSTNTIIFQGQPIIKSKVGITLQDVYGGESTGETVYAAM